MNASAAATTTFLFTDIVQSARQWETSIDMGGRVDRHLEALHSEVARHDGEVFCVMGDGVAAAFTSASAAVNAAICSQLRMPAIGLDVRMGLHTGEAERIDGDYRGPPVNRSARIMALAHGGQILLSDMTARLVSSDMGPVRLRSLGTHHLRGLVDPDRLWQVVHPDLRRDFPPLVSALPGPTDLPTARSSLVGRDREVAEVLAALDACRVVTLTGVGGVGKTRLALQAATERASRGSRAWFVELAGVVSPDRVGEQVALALGTGPAADPVAAVTAVFGDDDALLVLNDAEHVVGAVATLVDSLITRCPGLTMMVTSREVLGVVGERVHHVRPLDPATTAVELFEERAADRGAVVDLTERPLVERLCRRLDGLPLAIELAAARCVALGVTGILGDLDDQTRLPGGRRRGAVGRHSSLKAAIDWSYRLLDDDEQRLLRWLAPFPDGFEPDAVAHVARAVGFDAPFAVEPLESLVNKSVLESTSTPTGVRYRMLATIRAFLLEELEASGDAALARGALVDWMASITDVPFRDACSARVERNSVRLEREVEAWCAAISWAATSPTAELAARLCGPPTAFFLLGRPDLAGRVGPLLDRDDIEEPHRRAILCAALVTSAGVAGPDQIASWLDELDAIEECAPTGVGVLMRWLVLTWQGDFEGAIRACRVASLDPRISQDARDMFVGIATLDRFSLTGATDDPDGLIERALDVERRSEVALHRVACRLGIAWSLIGRDPDRSLRLVSSALADIDEVAAFTRITLPGNASRLIMRLDPRSAASVLLDTLDLSATTGSWIDLLSLYYATALLHSEHHPSSQVALATLRASPLARHLPSMSFIDSSWSGPAADPIPLEVLEQVLVAALTEIAAPASQPTDAAR